MIIVTAIAYALDDTAARRLRTAICRHIAQGNILHVLDMRELAELDSRTLTALIRVLRIVREVGGSICIVADHSTVLNTLSLTAFDRLVGVYRNIRDAVLRTEQYASYQSMTG